MNKAILVALVLLLSGCSEEPANNTLSFYWDKPEGYDPYTYILHIEGSETATIDVGAVLEYHNYEPSNSGMLCAFAIAKSQEGLYSSPSNVECVNIQ